jgi:hypothetical protein
MTHNTMAKRKGINGEAVNVEHVKQYSDVEYVKQYSDVEHVKQYSDVEHVKQYSDVEHVNYKDYVFVPEPLYN